jgi:hypothetical protein
MQLIKKEDVVEFFNTEIKNLRRHYGNNKSRNSADEGRADS